MKARVWLGLAVAGVISAVALASGALRAQPPLEALASRARDAGIEVTARAVQRGLFEDRLHDVRATFPGGAIVRAREATLSRRPFGVPSVRTPALELTLAGDPVKAHELLAQVSAPKGLEVQASRVSVRYQHRTLGTLVLDGVHSGPGPESLRVEAVELAGARFHDVVLAGAKRKGALEIRLGAERGVGPGATATYVPSDGRAAEWRLMVPHQPLAPLRAAVGLGAPADDVARVAGTLSWIVPDDPALAPRGSFRFVIDGWPRPPWPEASAFTGATGALAAVVRSSPAGGEVPLERVEVSAALFELRGGGALSLRGAPRLTLAASGRRTCAELARGLPPSRHRDQVGAYLAAAPRAPARSAGAVGSEASESVELGVQIELVQGPSGALRFLWHLSAGCGLPEMSGAGG